MGWGLVSKITEEIQVLKGSMILHLSGNITDVWGQLSPFTLGHKMTWQHLSHSWQTIVRLGLRSELEAIVNAKLAECIMWVLIRLLFR